MSILKMDQFGNIVEDNGEGEIRTADMVADDNVAKLSVKEDAQVLKDRASLKRIDDINTKLSMKQRADMVLLKAYQEKQAMTNAERLYALQQKMAYLQELKKSIKISQALLEGRGNQYHEKMSGVTGYGFTADGRRPEQSTSFFDYAPIEDVTSAFGSLGIQDDPVGFEKLSDSDKDRIRRYVLNRPQVISGTVNNRPVSFDLVEVFENMKTNPNAYGVEIDWEEREAARERGWGTTYYTYKEGSSWVGWPYKVPYHPNVFFLKKVDMTGRSVVPDFMILAAIPFQALERAYKLGIDLTSGEPVPVVAQAQVSTAAPTPVVVPQQTAPAPAVEEIKQQEIAVEKAIEDTQKQIEAQIQTVQNVAEVSATPQAIAAQQARRDFRHPMLVFGLVQKSAPLVKEKQNLLFGLGRPNYTTYKRGK